MKKSPGDRGFSYDGDTGLLETAVVPGTANLLIGVVR